MISKTTRIGTLKNIPLIPQIFPIILRVINITIGLRFSDLPIIFGSIKFPTKICIIIKKIKIKVDWKKSKNWTSEKIKGRVIEISEPINGIKFNKNEIIPKKIDKSLLKRKSTENVNNPVKKLVNVLIWK